MDARESTVPQIDNLFGPQVANLSAAMSRTTQRHALLSDNLANVNTPGYKRKDIDFGIELQQAIDAHAGPRDFHLDGSANGVKTDYSDVRVDGSSVDLETEVVSMAETELRYQALTDITARYFGNLKNVIREGK
jgi:flagellar basal-body rod protein FlgB